MLFLALLVSGAMALPADELQPDAQHALVSRVVAGLFAHHHYTQKAIDDSVSKACMDFYVESLDPNRSILLGSDVAAFTKYRYQLDNFMQDGELTVFYDLYNTLAKRLDERIAYANKFLSQPEPDFAIIETYTPDRKDAAWAKTPAELDEIWRRRIKNEVLNLKLTGKDWPQTVSTLSKRYANYQKRISQNTTEDVFQIVANALAQVFDPHSNYLSPIASDNFGIDMSLSLQGIGAQLTSDMDYTLVARIIPGGPADRSKQIWPNDKIIAVGQGERGEMVDVIGMRLDDVVQLIRGPKGTSVRLDVIPAEAPTGNSPKKITLVRDKIILREGEARSDTIEMVHEGRKYRLGVIVVPTFYSDLAAQNRGETNYKSTTRDVRRLITELKGAHVDGLIIDLRGNSGGALQEAIELTGLFIDEGPVVQVRNSDGSVRVMKDPDRTVDYDGPLAVLVDRRSASASEIFSGAIQDYDRGLVIGSSTFGKGTVQNLIELNRYVRNPNAKFGQLKLTVAKFYRIAGGTTQHRGVVPDIAFPSIWEERGIGESTEVNALPWDQIQPTAYARKNRIAQDLPQLRAKSQKRMALNLEYRFLQEDIAWYEQERERKEISLQESNRRQEQDKLEAERFAKENERRVARGLKPLKKGEKPPQGEKDPDFVLDESTRILADLIGLKGLGYQSKANGDQSKVVQ